MAKLFEDKFMDLQKDMISICLEYVDGYVEKIYVYASVENNTHFFNYFYQIKGHIAHCHKVNDYIEVGDKIVDVSLNRQSKVLDIGLEDLKKIVELCKENNRDIPTEFKLIYDVKKGSLETNYKYEPVWAGTKDKTNHNVFESWYEEVKNEVEV